MVGEKFGVATMGSSILLYKAEDFGTGESVLTTMSIVLHSPNSKNVANVDPHKTHNYEFSWLVRSFGLQPWAPRFYHTNPKILGRGGRC